MSTVVDKQSLDPEMYAIAMCIEGLEPIKDNPRALSRVLDLIANRYIDNLQRQLARLDAEIKVVSEKLAHQKYNEASNERTVDSSDNDLPA